MPNATHALRTFTRSVVCSEPNCPVCTKVPTLTRIPARPKNVPIKSTPSDVDFSNARGASSGRTSTCKVLAKRGPSSLGSRDGWGTRSLTSREGGRHAATTEKTRVAAHIAVQRTKESATLHSDTDGTTSHSYADTFSENDVSSPPPDTVPASVLLDSDSLADRRSYRGTTAHATTTTMNVPHRGDVRAETRVVASPSAHRPRASQRDAEGTMLADNRPPPNISSCTGGPAGATDDTQLPHVTAEEANLLRRLREELPISRACTTRASSDVSTPRDSQKVRDAMTQYGRVHGVKIVRKTKDKKVDYVIGDVVTKVKLVDSALFFRPYGTTTWQPSHEFDPRPLSARTVLSTTGSSQGIQPSSPTANSLNSPTTTRASQHDVTARPHCTLSASAPSARVGDARRTPQHSAFTIFGHEDSATDERVVRPRFVLTTVEKPPPVIRLAMSPPSTKRSHSMSAPRASTALQARALSTSLTMSRVSGGLLGPPRRIGDGVSGVCCTATRGGEGPPRWTAQSSASHGGLSTRPFGQRLSLLPMTPIVPSNVPPRGLSLRDLSASRDTASSRQSKASQPIDQAKPPVREILADQWQYCSA